MRLGHWGIRAKLIGAVAIPTLIVYLGVLGVMFARLSAAGHERVDREMQERAVAYAGRFDAAFERAAAVARTTADALAVAPELTDGQVLRLLRADVTQDEAIYGAAAAFEPAPGHTGDELRCPYVCRAPGGEPGAMKEMNIGRSVYDWYADPKWTWYQRPKATGAPEWSDPYMDEGAGNVLMVTYSAPFVRAHAEGAGTPPFGGVATVDIQVSKIRERVGAKIVGSTEFLILTAKGEFVYSPRVGDVMSGRTAFDVMDRTNGRQDIVDALKTAVEGRAGVSPIQAGAVPAGWEAWRGPARVFYAPVKSTGWVFAAVVPDSVALASVRASTREAAIALGLTLALITACIFIAGTLLVRPITRMGAAVRRIASGDLEEHLEVTSRDELGRLAHDVNRMATDLKQRTEEVAKARASSREAMIFALAQLAQSRDTDTGKHLERICGYTEVLAREVSKSHPELDGEWIRTVTVTAALHDIGKVGVPDAVLKKPGKLTDDEFKKMQAHTTIGGDTLIAVRRDWKGDDFLRTAAEIALAHHEHWDGKGYPYGLSREDISLAARIVAVADVYDALTSKRVYKPAMPHEQAVQMIVDDAGKHFDPDVVAAFTRVEAQFREISVRMHADDE